MYLQHSNISELPKINVAFTQTLSWANDYIDVVAWPSSYCKLRIYLIKFISPLVRK